MRARNAKSPELSREILKHYEGIQEQARLRTLSGQLEFYRTKEIISRHLPKKRAVILDIGGGPGRYALWLAKLGHTVHLVDPVPVHVGQAKAASDSQRGKRVGKRLASASVGDARSLEFADESADGVLLLGPLYHLVKRKDRVKALSEANRALKPGGLLFAAVISRFASAFDGLFRNLVKDPKFFRIVLRDLKDGQHRNPGNHPRYFTTAFFHHPDELRIEMEEAGFEPPQLYGLEGPGWLLANFEQYWSDPKLRARLLTIIRSVETEPTLMGQSAHILAMARKS
jgi:ubiquinone/menaquinone biosynthesis C-methylase UbiE